MKNLFDLRANLLDLDQRERKSSQVNASGCKAWPNGVASKPKFSTCVHLRLAELRGAEAPLLITIQCQRALFCQHLSTGQRFIRWIALSTSRTTRARHLNLKRHSALKYPAAPLAQCSFQHFQQFFYDQSLFSSSCYTNNTNLTLIGNMMSQLHITRLERSLTWL